MIEPLRTGPRLDSDYMTAAHQATNLGVTFERCEESAWDAALALQQRLLPVGTGRFGPDHFVLGAYLKGELIGFSATLAMTIDGVEHASHHLHSMGVDPRFRLNGIGRVLTDLPQREIERNSGRPPHVWGGCSRELTKFYRKIGFSIFQVGEVVPIPEGPFRNGNEHHPFTFMRVG